MLTNEDESVDEHAKNVAGAAYTGKWLRLMNLRFRWHIKEMLYKQVELTL